MGVARMYRCGYYNYYFSLLQLYIIIYISLFLAATSVFLGSFLNVFWFL